MRVLRETACPYGHAAIVRVHMQSVFPATDSVAWREYIHAASSFLRELPCSVDIAALELPIVLEAASEGMLARVANTVLAGLTLAAHGDVTPLYENIETSGWELRLYNRNFFPLVLSPTYTRDHPRFIPWRQSILVIQPEDSFTRHGVTSANSERLRLSERAEQAFQRNGQRYFPAITRDLPKAFRLIKPDLDGVQPVRWWNSRTLVPLDTLDLGR